MSGWRDESGRTAAERGGEQRAQQRVRFIERVRNRPLTLLRPALTALFIGVLVFALFTALT